MVYYYMSCTVFRLTRTMSNEKKPQVSLDRLSLEKRNNTFFEKTLMHQN